LPSARGAAMLLASIGHGGSGSVAQAALLRQLANVIKALHDARQAAGDAQRAAEIANVVRTQLVSVSAGLPRDRDRPAARHPDADAAQIAAPGPTAATRTSVAASGVTPPASQPPGPAPAKRTDVER
jgi:hypothetical protein